MTKNYYQNVSFFLAVNSFFGYFKAQELPQKDCLLHATHVD